MRHKAGRTVLIRAAIGVLCLSGCQAESPDDRRLVVMDSDPTIGLTPISEVDDGFDIAVLTRREDVNLLGLTIVFGNGALEDEVHVARVMQCSTLPG